MAVMTGMDFFTVEVLTWRGLITYYVLFVIQLETRKVILAGIPRSPTAEWMQQGARNLTDSESGALTHQQYLLHDRDTKFCSCFTATLSDGGLQPLKLPARSPNLNAFAKRWIRSVEQECLSKLILCSEASLNRVLAEYLEHYHTERNHQGKRNLLLFPAPVDTSPPGKPILCKQRLGGLLKYYARAA
jgi:putative transposase